MSAPYLGDFAADQAVNFMWDTNSAAGASITRSADGAISVYKDNSDGTSFDQTQVTTDVTNDEDVDGLIGVHSCCITTTDGWYETGHDYVVVLSASTIDGQTVNAVLATFSIENRFEKVTLADGAHGGAAAVMTLKQLSIVNDSGVGMIVTGTSIGLDVNGTDGIAVDIDGTVGGIDINGGNSPGISAVGGGGAAGIFASGGTGNGDGIYAAGGLGGGAGIRAVAEANNDAGMELVANGTGADLDLTGSGTIEDGAGNIVGVNMAEKAGDAGAVEESQFPDGTVYVATAAFGGTGDTTWPTGTTCQPTNTVARGVTIAAAYRLHTMDLHGDHQFLAAMENYVFRGHGHIEFANRVDINGQSVEHTMFERLVVQGATGNAAGVLNMTRYVDCLLWAHTNINGYAIDGGMAGACSILDGGTAIFVDVKFGGMAACTLTLQAPVLCDLVNMRGTLTLAGMDGGVCTIRMQNGANLTIDNTCTAGTITITGSGTVIDNSGAGCTVNITTPEADLIQINGDLTDGSPDVDDRPILYLQQLRCACDIAGQGAIEAVNVNATGIGQVNSGGDTGQVNTGINYGQENSGVTADVLLSTTGTIVDGSGNDVIEVGCDKTMQNAIPGAPTANSINELVAHFAEMTADDGAVRQFTANALELLYTVDLDQVEAAAAIDSLCTLILAAFHSNLVDNLGKLTVYRTNDTTVVNQFDVTSSNTASPVTGVSD